MTDDRGTILKVTRFGGVHDNELEKRIKDALPAYAVIENCQSTVAQIRWLSPMPATTENAANYNGPEGAAQIYYPSDETDHSEEASVDDLNDEECARLAMFMMGVTNDD